MQMDLFFLLLTNLIPLYLIIAAGFFGGRYLGLDRHTLANFALYLCVPVVIFGFVAELDLKPAYALLPVIAYVISAIIAFAFLKIGKTLYGDNRANLLAMCASMGNTGYFGLPVALLLFDKHYIGVYMFMMIGITGFEGTIGYYIAARGKFTVRDSFRKLAQFPNVYAMIAGLLVNFSGYEMPELFNTYWAYFKGAYVISGMMIIGVSMASVKKLKIAPDFVALSFAGKFLAWPLLTFVFVAMDRAAFHLFEPEVYKLLYLLAAVPFAANIAAFSAQMDLKPEKAATTILLGTVFALFYIPLVMGLAS
ncbi:MAG: AEC family transporter [Alphaproteobacteria bacterium]|nr:AEC family transporter [Alphaproteobacteria bacterium]